MRVVGIIMLLVGGVLFFGPMIMGIMTEEPKNNTWDAPFIQFLGCAMVTVGYYINRKKV